MIAMSDEYFRVCIEAWADEVAKRYGPEIMREIQAEAWQTIVLPQLRPCSRSGWSSRPTRPRPSSLRWQGMLRPGRQMAVS